MPLQLKSLDLAEANNFIDSNKYLLFSSEVEFEFWKIQSESETKQMEEAESHYTGGRQFAFGAFDNDKLIGIHRARQKEKCMLHMSLSGVLPEYRRKGIYSQLLNHVIAEAKSLGFQGISSRHNASNNAVIIPKLKAGFLINAFEICDVQGMLIHLVYHLNESRLSMHRFRTGYAGIPEKAKPAIRNLFL